MHGMDATQAGPQAQLNTPLISMADVGRLSHARVGECSDRLLHRLLCLVERATHPPWDREIVMLPCALDPQNPSTGHRFTGQNRMMLMAELWDRNLADPRFMTFRQALQMGKETDQDIAVRKGEKAITILRPCRIGTMPAEVRLSEDMTLGDLVELGLTGAGDGGDEARVYLTAYSVFHASQISNLPPFAGSIRSVRADGPHRIDAFIAASGIGLAYNDPGATLRPYYDPLTDHVFAPPHEQGQSREESYCDLLDTWYHATGGAAREGRATGAQTDLERPVTDLAIAAEQLRADVFVTIAMPLAGMQPYLAQRTPEQLAAWRQLAQDPDARRVLAGATLEVLPMLDALQTQLAGQMPAIGWWGKTQSVLVSEQALADSAPKVPMPDNVVSLVLRPR